MLYCMMESDQVPSWNFIIKTLPKALDSNLLINLKSAGFKISSIQVRVPYSFVSTGLLSTFLSFRQFVFSILSGKQIPVAEIRRNMKNKRSAKLSV
jgi:hypothetical protein